LKIGIIKKDKSKVEIESFYEIDITDDQHETLMFIYITGYDDKIKDYIYKSLEIPKKDIQLIYFGDWK